MGKTRVLLVDDHRMFLAGLRTLLERQEDVSVVGEAENGQAGVALAAELSPDVVMMDLTMPGLNGVEATRQILARVPAARVIALSAHSDPHLVAATLEAGAAAYLLKSSEPEELVRAVRTVLHGHRYLSPDVTGGVVDGFLRVQRRSTPASQPSLSSREREVLQLLAEGRTAANITTLLKIGRKTVETYRRRLMLKLDLHTLADLVKYAIREKLISTDA
ncbi:MAG: response regulator transcription factor [Deltaproteobacteria bacterium]|nr:response regulator transcription factor [Deltaproteobacteria bacterium]